MNLTDAWTLLAAGTTSGQPVGCVDATAVNHGADTMDGVRLAMAPVLEQVRLKWFEAEGRDETAIVAVLTRPPTSATHYGLLFVAAAGPLGGCGEATMFAGSVASREAQPRIVFDTTSGPIHSVADGDGGVTLTMSTTQPTPLQHEVTINGAPVAARLVSAAGNVFVSLDAGDLGIDVASLDLEDLRLRGDELLRDLADQLVAAGDPRPGLLLVTEPVVDGETTSAIVWDGILNRGPCGTGTCARLVLAIADGEIAADGELTHRSPFGEAFTARLASGTADGPVKAVELSGRVAH